MNFHKRDIYSEIINENKNTIRADYYQPLELIFFKPTKQYFTNNFKYIKAIGKREITRKYYK